MLRAGVIMRKFIRHPISIPITFSMVALPEETSPIAHYTNLKDISEGGLSFTSPIAVEPGSTISITIPLTQSPFTAKGVVRWCKRIENSFYVGVQFNDEYSKFNVRMVEQICHIEAYQKEVYQKEGRELSLQEAALEWIKKFSTQFPKI